MQKERLDEIFKMCVARLSGRLSRAGQSILKNLCFESEKKMFYPDESYFTT